MKIPDVESFRDFLIAQELHEYAVVQRRLQNGPAVQYFFRLTAKLEERKEIAVCDITTWKGLLVNVEETTLNTTKDAIWKNIETTMTAGHVDEPGAPERKTPYTMHSIDGEYAASLD